MKLFGKFSYEASPLESDPEHITVTDNWVKENIVSIDIPQLASQKNGPTKVLFHKKAKYQFEKLWKDWEKAGLSYLVKTWQGSYAPRFRRGSTTILSHHAFGAAFDINAEWNKFGEIPALVGETGCVRRLVEIANDNGFYWGGHFPPEYIDGMHFEVAVIKKPKKKKKVKFKKKKKIKKARPGSIKNNSAVVGTELVEVSSLTK